MPTAIVTGTAFGSGFGLHEQLNTGPRTRSAHSAANCVAVFAFIPRLFLINEAPSRHKKF
jgi:hypothetical protein